MGRKLITGLVCLLLLVPAAHAQPPTELEARDVALVTAADAFGQPVTQVTGTLHNTGADGYTFVTLDAAAYDAGGAQVGEGFGFMADACGAALDSYTLRPGSARRFVITLELYEQDALVDRVDVTAGGTPIAADTLPPAPALSDLITPVTTLEVVAVEWLGETTLRFASGCIGQVFTAHTWYYYNMETGILQPTDHPDAARVTPALLEQLELSDPADYLRSFLSFPPSARRLVYQTRINTFVTAEPDGSFKRVLYDDLYRRSLQGIQWLPEGRFLAYYFGAFGEDVVYFVANVDGQKLSADIYNSLPSRIVPGARPDGGALVIGGTFDGVTGYFLRDLLPERTRPLFEGDVPGNNYPAPIYVPADTGDFLYLIRPVSGQPRLQCYNVLRQTLFDVTALPLHLGDGAARAWAWLSPDGNRLAVGASGADGGLWIVDVSAYVGCD